MNNRYDSLKTPILTSINNLTKPTLSRIPKYLNYLKSVEKTYEFISSQTIASELNLGVVLVRKDLFIISGEGKPKIGYNVEGLIIRLESLLGYHEVENTVLIGAGKLGMALYNYEGFEEYGLKIVAIFDTDEHYQKQDLSTKLSNILDLRDICLNNSVNVGIITTPAAQAQKVCDALIKAGIKGILNFAAVHLNVPPTVTVQNMNIATTLALLAKQIKQGDK